MATKKITTTTVEVEIDETEVEAPEELLRDRPDMFLDAYAEIDRVLEQLRKCRPRK